METPLKMTVVPNGPLKVEGVFEIVLADGTVELKEKSAFMCRCGHSSKKPYCDGSHRRENFVG